MEEGMFLKENITQNTSVEYLENKYEPYFNGSWNYYNETQNKSDYETLQFMQSRCYNVTLFTAFDKIQLARVIVTWILFFISAVGNSFVVFCIYKRARTSHVHMLMMHFAIADLVFTFTVMPQDAMWNTTMLWYGGDFLCRFCQWAKHTGMYISSFMVVVTALDRCFGILQPMCTPSKQRKRTKYLVAGVWVLGILSAMPAAIFYSVSVVPYCPDRAPMPQCVDYGLISQEALRPYYFFTMAMSFLLPMTFSVVFYSLVVWEITNMMQRDRARLGRRDSSVSIMRARRKTLMMTALVVLSFLLFWGPYYGIGIYDWFNPEKKLPKQITTVLFMFAYVHPAIHPFMYGVLMKDVRDAFKTTLLHAEKIITCSSSDIDELRRRKRGRQMSSDQNTGFVTSSTYVPQCNSEVSHPMERTTRFDSKFESSDPPSNSEYSPLQRNEGSFPLSYGYSPKINGSARSNDGQTEKTQHTRNSINGDERHRLISANSERASGGDDNTPPTETPTNGTLRTSTVSFHLPSGSSRSGSADENVINNNKPQRTESNRDDGIVTSTT